MTIFGPDISSYEAGLDLARLPDASFVFAKASEGTYYTDADYSGWRRQAGQLGRIFAWYHFLSTEGAAAQVAHTKACIGDLSLPGMLDFEPTQTMRPTLAQALAYADAAHAAGLNLRLVYLPEWYWQEIGSPSLAALTSRGLYLVSSNYPGGTGNPEQLYPGDSGTGWQAYGGVTPLIWQYTDKAADGGKFEDFNAFRGSVAQLLACLGSAAPTTTGDGDVTPDEHNWLTNLYSGLFFGGPSCGRLVPGGQPGGGANSVFSHLDYMTSLLEKTAAGVSQQPMSAAALAAALAPVLAPMLPAGGVVDPAPIAAAVVTALKQHNLGGLSAAELAAALDAESATLKAAP